VSYSLPEQEPGDLVEPRPYSPLQPRFYIPVASPFWVRTLLAVNLVVFVAMIAYGWLQFGDWDGTTNSIVLTTFGMKVNDLVAQGQVWRLFTAMFLHIGALHLLSNLYALHALGPLVEGYFGHGRFLAIYLIGGLTGSVASYAFSAASSAGASGAVFALIGATTVYFLRYRDNFGARGRAIVQNMFVIIAINLVFGLSIPFIDNWGHIGGLIGGAIVAWGLLPRYRPPEIVRLGDQPIAQENRTMLELGWVLICLVLLLVAVQYVTSARLSG
jgi:membrane associated rhomboid family serine protease